MEQLNSHDCGSFFIVMFDPYSPDACSPVPTAPRNVTLSAINQTTMMVAWEEPTMPNGILGPYNVCAMKPFHGNYAWVYGHADPMIAETW